MLSAEERVGSERRRKKGLGSIRNLWMARCGMVWRALARGVGSIRGLRLEWKEGRVSREPREGLASFRCGGRMASVGRFGRWGAKNSLQRGRNTVSGCD